MRNDSTNTQLKLRPTNNDETTINGEGSLQWWRTKARPVANTQTLDDSRATTPIKSERRATDTIHWLSSWLSIWSLFKSLAQLRKGLQPTSGQEGLQTPRIRREQTSSVSIRKRVVVSVLILNLRLRTKHDVLPNRKYLAWNYNLTKSVGCFTTPSFWHVRKKSTFRHRRIPANIIRSRTPKNHECTPERADTENTSPRLQNLNCQRELSQSYETSVVTFFFQAGRSFEETFLILPTMEWCQYGCQSLKNTR